jgi:hypothetical protein
LVLKGLALHSAIAAAAAADTDVHCRRSILQNDSRRLVGRVSVSVCLSVGCCTGANVAVLINTRDVSSDRSPSTDRSPRRGPRGELLDSGSSLWRPASSNMTVETGWRFANGWPIVHRLCEQTLKENARWMKKRNNKKHRLIEPSDDCLRALDFPLAAVSSHGLKCQ